jgi:hypothetical protein
MLGKQRWNEDCLVSKLFKVRYLPRSDFFGIKIGHNPSYVWRCILSSKDVVKMEAQWCIGTCSNISLMDNPGWKMAVVSQLHIQ